MPKLIYLTGKVQEVDAAVADKLRYAWVTKHYANKAQAEFVKTIQKIAYGETDEYCLHRYRLKHVIPMGRSKGYVMECPQCLKTFATDAEPVDNYEQNSIDSMAP